MACKIKKPTTSSEEITVSDAKSIIVNPDFVTPETNGSFEVTDAKISGDVLIIDVTFSGGCKEHEFNAYWNGVMMKSMPPKIGLYIEHKTNDDNCRKVINETLRFDLSNLKPESHQNNYTIMVGFSNFKSYLEYSY